jgi:hypothetical protein
LDEKKTTEQWENVVSYKGLSICTIAKCGTTSIRDAFLRAQGIEKENIIDYSDLTVSDRKYADGYKVAFIRHPIDRAISCWSSKLKSESVADRSGFLISCGFRVGCSLKQYIDDLEEYRHKDKHTDDQYKYLASDMDYIGRFEDISKHWKILQNKFQWLPDLRHLNRTNWINIDQKTSDRLLSIYRTDYMLWQSIDVPK